MAASPVFITSTTLHCALPLEIDPSTRPIATSPDFAQRSLKSGPVLAPRDSGKVVRRLVRLPASKPDLAGYDPNVPAPLPNEIPPVGRSATFDDRFGNWSSSSGVGAPVAPNQPLAPAPPAGRPPGLVTGEPMPDYPFAPTIFGFPGRSTTSGDEDFVWGLVRSP